tara:strand:- start:843 stop:1733 length:891 start_codon:yes stop_codon:yes gene_type:complete
LRYLLCFIISIAASNVNSQTVLPSLSGIHYKKSTDWSPSDVTISGWIDANDSENYTESGTTLTGVTDKSGTSSFNVNGTPTIVSAGLNSLSVFDFSGTSENIMSASYISHTDGSGNHWAIGVFLADNVNNKRDSFWSFHTTTSPERDYSISSATSSNSWPGEIDLDGLSNNRISSTMGNGENWSSSASMDNWHIVVAIFNKTGNRIQVRLNGSYVVDVSDYDNSIQTSQELRLMRNRGSVHLDGRVAEFFSVKDIPGTGGTDISDVEKAEGYLAHKWGLTGNLPVTHPYKSSAPSN